MVIMSLCACMRACVCVRSLAFSCDDKAKGGIGKLFGSKFHQIARFFLDDDSPQSADHDFPVDSKFHIIPSGTLQILYDTEETPGLVQDTQGRDHVATSRSGKLTIVNRSAKFMGSNSQTHMNDVYRIMNETERASSSEPKLILWIIADGGPDWNVKSPLALMSYGRLFRRLKKDVLGVSMPAPGHSRANEIERKWAPVTNLVAGVVLSASLPGTFTVRM